MVKGADLPPPAGFWAVAAGIVIIAVAFAYGLVFWLINWGICKGLQNKSSRQEG